MANLIFSFGDDVISPPSDCKKCYELGKPYIENQSNDVHEGDEVELKCILVVPSAIANQVELTWKKVSLNSEGQETLKKESESPGNQLSFLVHCSDARWSNFLLF